MTAQTNKDPRTGDLFGDEFEASMKEMLEHIDELDINDLKILWPARLVEIYEVISYTLRESADINDSEQNNENGRLSAALVSAVAHHFGGRTFYLPHNQKLDRAVRDIKIWKAFKGNNHAELAKQYRVSEMTIRTVVATQHKIRLSKIQPSLFKEE